VDSSGASKRLKRGRFVSRRLFLSLLAGERIPTPETLQEGDLWFTMDEMDALSKQVRASTERRVVPEGFKVWTLEEAPRVALDRVTQASNIFYFSRVAFSSGCGLFFLADVDPALRGDFETVVRVLGDTGIGGDRTAGCGQFEPVFEEMGLEIPENVPDFLTLSLLAPSEAEIEGLLGPRCAYGLARRDGWIDSPEARNYRRRACRMFVEGSVFRGPADRSYGRLVDVTPTALEVRLRDGLPGHRVYRYGYAFPVPIRLQEEGVSHAE
jgi:CRISPR-associated protein Csm4